MIPVDKNTLTGLRRALDHLPQRPEVPEASVFHTWMSHEERQEFQNARDAYVLDGLRLNMPAVREARVLINRLLITNRRMSGGRQALILDAPPSAGKTETAMACARSVERKVAAVRPDYRDQGEVPVAWVDVPTGATGKKLATAICTFFLEHPDAIPRRWTNDRVVSEAVSLLGTHQTQLLVIDEAHLIAATSGLGTNGEASDVIKELQNRTTTTVLMAGIDMMASGVLTTRRAAQLTSRSQRLSLDPIPYSTDKSRTAWASLCASFEHLLPLIGHEAGVIPKEAELLHLVTGGYIGPLAELMREIYFSVTMANPPNETITRESLKQHCVDWARRKGVSLDHTSGVKRYEEARAHVLV